MIVSGSPFQNMTIGGIKPEDGSDASNELSMLILDVTQHLKLPQPTVSVRYNDKLDEEFLLRAAEVVSTGGGQPTFFNDKYAFSVLPYYGISMEEVRDWAPTGCVEMNVPGTSALFWGSGYYAVPKIIELTLHNGFDPYIKKQVGPKTGEPETFDDFEKFWEALNKQLEFINKITSVTTAHSYINVPADYAPLIFHSVLTDDCIDRGKELHCGGPRHTSLQAKFPVGMMTGANSLTALKKLVFEDKELTLDELSAALEANFKGYEHIKKMCLEAPKYGNDDDYADEIAVRLFKVCNEIAGKNKNAMGENAHTGYLGITSHYYHGVTTGATPDGRLAGMPYGDGSISPVQGTDTKGPTAVIRSAGKIDAAPAVCTLFNQKFHPSALKNEDDWRKFISYFKTYFELGGYHIQFNCVDRELLLNAKAHPEDYQDLVVRVSGFCHRFVELDSYVQDDIINRTEQRW